MRRVFACSLVLAALPCLAADEDKWSTVKGRVVFDDSKHPIPKRVLPPAAKGANLPPCAAMDPDFLTEEWIVNAKNKGLKDAVVWLAPEPTADEWRRLRLPSKDRERLRDFPSFKPEQLHPDLKVPKAKTVEMDQPCCRFIPHQLAMQVGQTLVIKNSAQFPHNAKYDTANNGADNPLLSSGGKTEIPIKHPERAEIKILCNIHPWMWASVRVFDHPYFAVTNADGEYEIKNAPVGKYRIFVWHSTGAFSGKAEGRFGYELEIKPKTTEVKTYSITIDDEKKK
jgi:plastocyanin